MKIPFKFNPMGYEQDVPSGGAVAGERGAFIYWSNGNCAKSAMSFQSQTLIHNSFARLDVSSGGGANQIRCIFSASINVASGGSISNAIVLSTCRLTVSSGGVALNASVMKSYAYCDCAGTVSNATVFSGGVVNVSSGGVVSGAVLRGGTARPANGGSLVDTVVSSGGLVSASRALVHGVDARCSSSVILRAYAASIVSVSIESNNICYVSSSYFPEGIDVADGRLLFQNETFRYSAIRIGSQGLLDGLRVDPGKNALIISGTNGRLPGSPQFLVDSDMVLNAPMYDCVFSNNVMVSNCLVAHSCMMSNFVTAINFSAVSGARVDFLDFCSVHDVHVSNASINFRNCNVDTMDSLPCSVVSLTLTGEMGAHLSSASMLGQSNYITIDGETSADAVSAQGDFVSCLVLGNASVGSIGLSAVNGRCVFSRGSVSSISAVLGSGAVSIYNASEIGSVQLDIGHAGYAYFVSGSFNADVSGGSIFLASAFGGSASVDGCAIASCLFMSSGTVSFGTVNNVFVSSLSGDALVSAQSVASFCNAYRMTLDGSNLRIGGNVQRYILTQCSSVSLLSCGAADADSCNLNGASILADSQVSLLRCGFCSVASISAGASCYAYNTHITSGGGISAPRILVSRGLLQSCPLSCSSITFYNGTGNALDFQSKCAIVNTSSSFISNCTIGSGATCFIQNTCSGLTMSIMSGGSLVVPSGAYCADVVSADGAYCSGESIYYRE